MKKTKIYRDATTLPMYMIANMDEKAKNLFSQVHRAKKKEEKADDQRTEVAAAAAE